MNIFSVPKKELDLFFPYLSGAIVNRGVFRTESNVKMKLLAKIVYSFQSLTVFAPS